MNGIFAPGEEALFVSPSPNLTGATLDLTGAVAPVSFTGAFGTIFLSPTQCTKSLLRTVGQGPADFSTRVEYGASL